MFKTRPGYGGGGFEGISEPLDGVEVVDCTDVLDCIDIGDWLVARETGESDLGVDEVVSDGGGF